MGCEVKSICEPVNYCRTFNNSTIVASLEPRGGRGYSRWSHPGFRAVVWVPTEPRGQKVEARRELVPEGCMRTYIDESGTFVTPRQSGHSVCCMSALSIPDSVHDSVLSNYSRVVSGWGLNGLEPKGSSLNERKVAPLRNP